MAWTPISFEIKSGSITLQIRYNDISLNGQAIVAPPVPGFIDMIPSFFNELRIFRIVTGLLPADAENDFSSCCLGEDDFALIAVPSYGGRVPLIASERIAKIQGNGTRCAIICVYGNRAYEDTLVELYDVAEHSSFKVIAAVSAIAEHSIMHQYAAGRPDQQDKQELQNFAQEIFKKLNGNAAASAPLKVPGNRPYKKAGGAGLIPKADKSCTNCGLCAEKCPAQAISKENCRLTDSKKCISCMRCISLCPQSARNVNEAIVSIASLAIKKACSIRKNNELFI